MKYLTAIAGFSLALSGATGMQAIPAHAGEYDAYVSGALSCMAGSPGDASAQDACIVGAIEECQSKAGVYEACLDALREGYDAAIARVQAEELRVCEGKLDSACVVVLRGHALIRSGTGLNAQQWSAVLTGGE
ncbi:MAG: hypothetical protein P1U83_12310 [Roseovarius sp.]|nr:hypothetical protein [Roseovarius sp.]